MMLLELFKELMFPRKCVFCREILTRNENGICRNCRAELPEYEDRRYYPNLDETLVLWYYEDSVRDSILRFKFQNRPDYAKVFGPILALKTQGMFLKPDVITWVPVSRKRLRTRGYDQAELLAHEVSRELGIPAGKLLEKIRDNPAQSGISDAGTRRSNVRDTYQVSSGADLKGKRILLIDDILTTGATAGECARMLKQAGAERVQLAVLASGRYREET